MLTANILCALIWAFVLGPFTPGNLVVGFVLGFVLIWVAGGERARASGYVRRTRATVELAAYTLKELAVANVRVAYCTLAPLSRLRPAVLAIPLEPDATDAEITLLSCLITLTPGTLTLDVADDRSEIYVHFMYAGEPRVEISTIKEGFEAKIREVTRAREARRATDRGEFAGASVLPGGREAA
ncbi:MAG: Na+/H+ antiporter subunit E [Planctomycetota bacterium]